MSSCGSTSGRHGTLTAYKQGCRCPGALRAGARSQKRYRTRVARGQRFHTDSTGTRRRVQALAAIGWRAVDIAERIGTTPENVSQLGLRPTVFVSTARRISEIYTALADTPGPSRIGRERAATKGWLEPGWWDEDNIDDASYEPPTTDARHWSDVDPVAVARAKAGGAVNLTRAERISAILELDGEQVSHREIGRRLRVDARQVLRDLAEHRDRLAS